MDGMSLDALRFAVRSSKGPAEIDLVPVPDGYEMQIDGQRLTSQRGHVRTFKTADAAIRYAKAFLCSTSGSVELRINLGVRDLLDV